MPGPLNSIYAAVEPLIAANMVAIAPQLASSLTFGHGGSDRNAEAAPPRIVWVPVDEDYGPPRGIGGDEQVDGAGNMNLPNGALKPLYSRLVDVECDIWGAQLDDVDNTMINATVSAVHDALQGSYGIKSARWLLPEELMKDGECYRVTFQFAVPVTKIAPLETTTTITSETITYPNFHQGS